MADIPADLLVHPVDVEVPTTGDFYGPGYEPAVTVSCFASEKRRMVRDQSGAEVVAETTLTARLADADRFAIGARVTRHGGAPRPQHVISVSRHDDGGMGAWQHVEVALA